jgi:hypothetical protein
MSDYPTLPDDIDTWPEPIAAVVTDLVTGAENLGEQAGLSVLLRCGPTTIDRLIHERLIHKRDGAVDAYVNWSWLASTVRGSGLPGDHVRRSLIFIACQCAGVPMSVPIVELLATVDDEDREHALAAIAHAAGGR